MYIRKLGIAFKTHSDTTLSQEMSSGSCTCFGRIRPDKECRFTSPCGRADVEPKSKCYGVSPGVRVHRLLSSSTLPPPPSVAGAAASLLGLACLSLPKQPMINEALNTSSLSSGPGEPPQLNKQAQPLFYPAATILGLRWVDRQPPLPPLPPPAPSAGRNSQDLSELARINESPDISRRSTCVRDPTKSHLGVSERRENIPASSLNMCGTQAHTLAPYGGAVYERNML